ncbi:MULTISPECIES: Rne/Rng family ribonuclease [Gardnerella]|uniref:Ribonuclease E n=1 Tax=Gardnerella vaginalis TaxID=2702 RepID=A0AAP8ITM8_GARVA|nr:Rne/Rng family ribonuclease [Gardnerella sp. 30-4]PKZ59852.1 ribonuclease E/G [Gardnerella vaginalis]
MPRIIRERFNESEAENSRTVSKTATSAEMSGIMQSTDFAESNMAAGDTLQQSSGVTRRRRGRRVTRGAGAAGEAMELKVEDSSAKNSEPHVVKSRPITSLLFQEPVLPKVVNDRSEESSGSRNDLRDNSRDGLNDDLRDDLRDISRGRRGGRNSRDSRDSRDSSERKSRSERRENSSEIKRDSGRGNSRETSRETSHSMYSQDSEYAKNFQDSQDDRDEKTRKSQRSRRSRRLNAVERRAAAEVEQIEEDLAYDNIVYAPIDTRIDETLDVSDILSAENTSNRRSNRRNMSNNISNDDDARNENGAVDSRGGSNSRDSRNSSDEGDNRGTNDDYNANNGNDDDEIMITRRRRRRRSSRTDRNESRNGSRDLDIDISNDLDDDVNSRTKRTSLDEVSQEDRDLIPDPEELREQDEEETLYTRRRRRRRSKSSDDANSASSQEESSDYTNANEDDLTSRRSRKQQYIDEITDIEGSTRLEAKRQRRRDNRRERSRQNLLMEQDFLARRENVERLMVVRERDRHTQISVIEDNILVEHYVSDIQEVATVGNIYLGRIQNVLPSMEAAFVDIGQARNGVLYAGEVNWDMARLEGQPRRIELAFKSGDPVLVQVTKDPIGHKGARLTSQVTLAGRFLVLVPSGGMTGVSRKLSDRERSRLRAIVSKIAPKDMGVIIRTAADGASEESIEKDLDSLVKQWERIEAKREEYLHGKRPKLLQGEPDVAIRVVRDIFNDDFQKLIVEGEGVRQRIDEYLEMMAPDLRSKVEYWDPAEHEGKDVFDKWQIDSQLRKGMERQVYLPAGGSIVIDRTEAMTTIDVNTGRFIGRGKSLEETVTRCNLEASEEIARQLRLRDIGGMVMIDYVDMVMPANRDLVLRRLLECLARDRTKHQVAEVTSLGLVQMTRKRVGQGLVEAFSEECPTCKGRGFILHDEPTVSSEYADPYALKGGDPFVKTNKYGHGSATEQPAPVKQQGSSAEVRAKLARIAAASVITDAAHKSEEETQYSNFLNSDKESISSKADETGETADAGETAETSEVAETSEADKTSEELVENNLEDTTQEIAEYTAEQPTQEPAQDTTQEPMQDATQETTQETTENDDCASE